MRTMKLVWKPTHDLEVSQLDSNLFVFQFLDWKDKERVLEQEPWNFDNQIVILSELKGHEQPSDLHLLHVPLWVRVYDVPFNLRKRRFVELLGEKVGSFLDLNEERGLTNGRFIRFRSAVDAESPVLRRSVAQGADGKEVWVYFKYERLPWFCFHCGRMGYVARDCPKVDDADLLNPSLFQYGDDLRASPLKRLPSSFGSQLRQNSIKRKLVFKPSSQEKKDHPPDENVIPEREAKSSISTNAGLNAQRASPPVSQNTELQSNPLSSTQKPSIVDSPIGKIVAQVKNFAIVKNVSPDPYEFPPPTPDTIPSNHPLPNTLDLTPTPPTLNFDQLRTPTPAPEDHYHPLTHLPPPTPNRPPHTS
ncbi:hypothetical protein Tsubulata_031214 [Turnera subulata]|uniref:CCHC-type domain-containing protein n=1 Tax=Turnera subulata TaxID=218843 RepID=A0A9Q0GB92_9ROSI|nr:hypothetical protein Tsubulata_031214 [Turnera subulata]